MSKTRQMAVAGCVVGIGALAVAVLGSFEQPHRVAVDAVKMEQHGLSAVVAPVGAPGPAIERPNVVLVVVCTLRKDQLTPYGAPAVNSPFLQSVAEHGALFERAYTSSPWTRTASTAIMTGYHPIQLGMIEPGPTASQRRLSSEVLTLAESFRSNGYRTVGVTANPNTNAVFGFAQGFDAYVEMTRLWRESGHTKVAGFKAVASALDAVDETAESEPNKPLYLRMMILDPHAPIRMQRAEAQPYMVGDVPARVGKYRAMVARADLAISQLWTGLAERGMNETNTVLMVINDHGEGLSFPPHHGAGHGNLTFSATTAMPWLAYGAGVQPGHRIGGLASQVDVMPTLQEVAGFRDYDGPGSSWAKALQGDSRTSRTEAYVDTWKTKSSRAAVYTEDRSCHIDFRSDALRDERERLLPREVCYDETADTYQLTRVDVVPELLDTLKAWRVAREDEFDRWPHHETAEVESSLRAHLEALGYVQDDG